MRFGLILLAGATLFAADAKKNLSRRRNRRHHPEIRRQRGGLRAGPRNYVYRQTARIQELDDAGNTTGRWEMVSDIISHPTASAPNMWSARLFRPCTRSCSRPKIWKICAASSPSFCKPVSCPITGSATWATSRWTKSATYVFAVKPKKVEGRSATFQARSGWTIAICRS